MAIIRGGHRVVIAPDARALERPQALRPDAERRRRIRTLAGNWQLLARAPWLLIPFVNPAWFRFVSHKVLRLVGPLALVIVAWAEPGLALAGAGLAVLGRRARLPGRLARAFLEAQLLVALSLLAATRSRGRASRLWRHQEVSHEVP
jgi:hypothetical protein